MPEPTCCAPAQPDPAPRAGFWRRGGWLLVALPAWILAYRALKPLADALAFRGLGLAPGSHLGEAVAFLAYDLPKVLLLLTAVVFGVTFLQTFVSPRRVRDALARRAAGAGNVMAALFGIVTPFCSCSAVPLFIGFLRAGVPLGVTFSFLVAAPMVNEVALGLLLAMFGWKIAALYAGTGVAIAVFAGLVLGRLRMEHQLEDWVQAALAAPVLGEGEETRPGWTERVDESVRGVRDIVGKVWPYIAAGIAVGAFIHGFVPEGLMAGVLGRQAWYSVPLAVLVGVPLYSNAAGILPIVEALLAKGAALGSTLAFMMAVIGLSLPEAVILRKVLKPRLIGAFVGVVAAGILAVGYLFNAIL
ncbi:permease [Mesoterricola sediminis]|uniref:Permease n=1 Tax=Mesoterricola sediminis TaxID=2927980 RepID=A0AA48KFG4_9BACT|nr:permease [Mesoterricola sediminis]BDU76433.1 permease [Mesoterricola sediminis]